MQKRSGGSRHITMPILFLKFVYPWLRYFDFSIFQMAGAAILDFWNHEIFFANRVQMVETHQRAKIRPNWSSGCKYIKIFRFSNMAVVRHLGFIGAYLGHPQWVLGVSIILQNLVMIDAVVFITRSFQYLARLAGKRLFSLCPKIGVFGQFDPINGLQYQLKPK